MDSALRPVQDNPPGLIPQGSIADTWRRTESGEDRKWMDEDGFCPPPGTGQPPGANPHKGASLTHGGGQEKRVKGEGYRRWMEGEGEEREGRRRGSGREMISGGSWLSKYLRPGPSAQQSLFLPHPSDLVSETLTSYYDWHIGGLRRREFDFVFGEKNCVFPKWQVRPGLSCLIWRAATGNDSDIPGGGGRHGTTRCPNTEILMLRFKVL